MMTREYITLSSVKLKVSASNQEEAIEKSQRILSEMRKFDDEIFLSVFETDVILGG